MLDALSPRMTLKQWLEDRRDSQDAFVRYWLKHDASMFPLENTPGDWDEQFDLFCEGVKDADSA